MQKKFEFLSGALSLTHVKEEKNFSIGEKVIALNNDTADLLVNGYRIRPNKSVILSNCTIEDARNVILCSLPGDYKENASYPHLKEIADSWIRFGDIDLFVSEPVSADGVNLRFVFAPAGTNCGLHNEHGYKEFHTQVFGIGIMQKFYENDFGSFNLEEYMAPGYTHEPFHYDDITYPWHQYYAVTDCVWFVAEIG